MKGVKGVGTEVECKGDWDDSECIWGYFERGILGSGQMATNSFEVTFPDTYAVDVLKGVSCRVTAVVKKIMYKVPKDVEDVTEGEARVKAEGEVRERRAQKWMAAKDEEIMKYVCEHHCVVDTEKVEESVSWAKFGPKSLAKFQDSIVRETIAKREGIEVKDVRDFLRGCVGI